jgi:hypothetical protein
MGLPKKFWTEKDQAIFKSKKDKDGKFCGKVVYPDLFGYKELEFLRKDQRRFSPEATMTVVGWAGAPPFFLPRFPKGHASRTKICDWVDDHSEMAILSHPQIRSVCTTVALPTAPRTVVAENTFGEIFGSYAEGMAVIAVANNAVAVPRLHVKSTWAPEAIVQPLEDHDRGRVHRAALGFVHQLPVELAAPIYHVPMVLAMHEQSGIGTALRAIMYPVEIEEHRLMPIPENLELVPEAVRLRIEHTVRQADMM